MFTPDILDFDTEDMELDRAGQALVHEPASYIYHLLIAWWLSGWAERLERRPTQRTRISDMSMRQVAYHLRQGDLVPGGYL